MICVTALALASIPSLYASTGISVLESTREEITQETILDLRDYPHYRYLPSNRFGLFARCVTEKRIQMAKSIKCAWIDDPTLDTQEPLENFLQCLARGGFSEVERERHREFCAFLMREHFKDLESRHLEAHSPDGLSQ